MLSTQNLQLTSNGYRLDTSDEAFGELRDSSYLAGDGESLRNQMQEDGYLFMRGYLDREEVLDARREVTAKLAAEGLLEAGTDPMDAIIRKGAESVFRPDLTENNPPLMKLLYSGAMMEFYEEFFSEPIRHYDFTWLRAVSPGMGTKPHCDMVYMGRGTREKLMTTWVPLGDAPLSLGGLIVLENSHLQHERLRHYLERDVDTYCTDGRYAEEIAAGRRQWTWNGVLSKDPVSLRQKLGGRWLTTEFEPGDLLTFGMYTVHASLDNGSSDRLRFSSDSRYQPASLPADERWIGANPIAHGQAGKRGKIC
jgi:ectoine hydroxylase-related dioxygenase (phytanoyl-CoA dioxygenase family)